MSVHVYRVGPRVLDEPVDPPEPDEYCCTFDCPWDDGPERLVIHEGQRIRRACGYDGRDYEPLH